MPRANAVTSARVVWVTTETSLGACVVLGRHSSGVTAYESTNGTSYAGGRHVTNAVVADTPIVAATDLTGPGT